MTLYNILQDRKNFDLHTLKINGSTVWDYKEGKNKGDVLLITENSWNEMNSEHVSVQELCKYIDTLDTPYSEVILYSEEDYSQLKTFEWLQDTLVLSQY